MRFEQSLLTLRPYRLVESGRSCMTNEEFEMLNKLKLITVCGLIVGLGACSQDAPMLVDTGAITSDAPASSKYK